MVPLQIPGFTELLVVLLNLLLLAGLVAAVSYLYRRFSGSEKDDRIEELENRVEELEGDDES